MRIVSKGFVSEIFFSVQGEGLYVGKRQVFVRAAGCSVECCYCDTPGSRSAAEKCSVHLPEPKTIVNPVGTVEVMREVKAVINAYGPVHSISITGGEPMEQARFTKDLCRALKQEGFIIYLDTNGIDARAIAETAIYVDIAAVDLKMPSAVGRPYWDEHEQFLREIKNSSVFVKIVVDVNTSMGEIQRSAALVSAVNPGIPFVLQPESKTLLLPHAEKRKFMDKILDCQKKALSVLEDVRIIPQCHKVLGVR